MVILFAPRATLSKKYDVQRIARMEAEIAPASLARGSENPRTFVIDILDFIIRDFRRTCVVLSRDDVSTHGIWRTTW